MGLCILALGMNACSEDNGTPDGVGSGECSYRVTIEGQTTLPNEFGLDRIVITGGRDDSGEEEIFAFSILQSKVDTDDSSYLMAFIHGSLNSETREGDFPVNTFTTQEFDSPEFQQYPLYVNGDQADEDHVAENVTFTLLENSGEKIRMKISGNLMKLEEVEGELVEVGLFPVEAELTVGRKYFVETEVEGVLIGGAVCDCQE